MTCCCFVSCIFSIVQRKAVVIHKNSNAVRAAYYTHKYFIIHLVYDGLSVLILFCNKIQQTRKAQWIEENFNGKIHCIPFLEKS